MRYSVKCTREVHYGHIGLELLIKWVYLLLEVAETRKNWLCEKRCSNTIDQYQNVVFSTCLHMMCSTTLQITQVEEDRSIVAARWTFPFLYIGDIIIASVKTAGSIPSSSDWRQIAVMTGESSCASSFNIRHGYIICGSCFVWVKIFQELGYPVLVDWICRFSMQGYRGPSTPG